MAAFITPTDVAVFLPWVETARVEAMIRVVSARATALAPCIAGPLTPAQTETVRAILLDAVVRWGEAGSGAVRTQTAGPFSQTVDTTQDRRGVFLASEFADLRGTLAGAAREAFSIIPGGARPVGVSTEYGRERDALDLRRARMRGWVS